MRFLRHFAFTCIGLYLCLFVAALFLGESLAFQPPGPSYKMDSTGYVMTKTADGTAIAMRWLPVEGARYTVIYAHGNAEDIGQVLPNLQRIRSLGFSVLSFDYEGYGHSGGDTEDDGVYRSAQAAWDFLTLEQGIIPENIAVFGFSMGGASACYLPAEEAPRAVVLAGAFASAFHAVSPINPFPWALLDNRPFAKRITAPVLILHGTKDAVVPPRNAGMLAGALRKTPHRVVMLPFGHNDLLPTMGPAIWQAIGAFIENPQSLDQIPFVPESAH